MMGIGDGMFMGSKITTVRSWIRVHNYPEVNVPVWGLRLPGPEDRVIDVFWDGERWILTEDQAIRVPDVFMWMSKETPPEPPELNAN